MNQSGIISQIETAVKTSRPFVATARIGAAQFNDTHLTQIQPVAAALALDPLMKELQGKYVENDSGFANTVSLDRLAQWLIYRARVVGPVTAVTEAKKIAESNEAEMRTVLALGGIRPSADVLLGTWHGIEGARRIGAFAATGRGARLYPVWVASNSTISSFPLCGIDRQAHGKAGI